MYLAPLNKFFIPALCFLLLAISSCQVAKNLPDGQSLLVKNKFIYEGKLSPAEKDKLRTDLPAIAAQKPNRKIFGFMPMRMWFYYSASNSKKLNKFRKWIIDKVGEPPVVFDSLLLKRSELAMENYMFNFGYFQANIVDTAIIKNKKTTVVYRLKPGNAWKIGTVKLMVRPFISDSVAANFMKNSRLITGQRFDIANHKAERERIETVLRNNGFYYFNREYITFDFDTSPDNNTVNVKIFINQPSDTAPHRQFRLNNFYITTDYVADRLNETLKRDTVFAGDSLEYAIFSAQRILRKLIVADAMFMKRGEWYNKEKELRTINRFAQLGVFKFISMDMVRARNREGNYLDALISLTPAKRQSFIAGGEMSVTNEGLFGLSGAISYKNKNLSKRADQFVVDISSGVQLRFPRSNQVELITTNAAISATYFLNRMVGFSRYKSFSKSRNPRTRLNIGYNYEYRNDFDTNSVVTFLYQLHNFNLTYGYDWLRGRYITHVLNPVAINFYLLPEKGKEFLRRLDLNPILKSSFEEQVTISQFYSFTYNNQVTATDKRYMYFRASAEAAGNLIYAGFKAINTNTDNDSLYLIAQKPFSQFVRMEADFRNYFRIRQHGMFALRTYAGIGVPYGNSYALPFIKQFFVGGPNSLRGFLIREIGPGSYVDSTIYNPETGKKKSVGFFNQTGDIKLELNAEFRFDLYRWLKAAVFVDAGNVWTIRKDNRSNGNFDINRFWKEFAVDAGAGLRFDFNFFVIRFDYGFPIRDPRRTDGNRWQFKNGQAFKSGQFQLAIGHPF